MTEYKLYYLIDPIDKKIRYVGITKNSLNQRLIEHICFKSASNHKQKWIRKLEKTGHKPIIKLVFDNLTKEEACKMEIELISSLKVNSKLTNISPGGEAPRGMLGKKHSEETKKKMSLAQSGEKSVNWNKKLSVESRKKMSLSHIERYKIPGAIEKATNHFKKMVVQLKNNEEICFYESLRDASKKTGIAHQGISQCCRNKQTHAGGFQWRFVNES